MGGSLYNKIPVGRRSGLSRLRAWQVLSCVGIAILFGLTMFYVAA